MIKKNVILIFSLFLTSNLFGQHSKPDTLEAVPCNETIKLDGKLIESCWLNASTIENFTQREQNEGDPATEKTRIAIVYLV